MGTTSTRGRDKRLTPGLAVAAAAGAAGLLAVCGLYLSYVGWLKKPR